jgi:tetratricopeptide (TPR) repeat protein
VTEPSAVLHEVERIASSRPFRSSASLVRLLRFLVAETEAGRGDRLKEYTLGTEVFDRGEGFDPRVDTIVRVQARRLRAKLTEYYGTEGQHDPVVIRLAPGSYVPAFELQPPIGVRRPTLRSQWPLRALAAGTLVLCAMTALAWRMYATGSRTTVSPTTVASAAGAYSTNPEAHALYLEAKSAYARGTRDALRESVALYQQATRVDPQFAAAYAGLAYAQVLGSSNFVPPTEAMPKARASAQKALDLDDTIVEGHTALGYVALFYDWDFARAASAIDRALALNRYSSTAHELRGQLFAAEGRFADAALEIQEAQHVDPLSPTLEYDAAWNLIYERRYAESVAACRRALRNDPNFVLARGLLGLALVLDGQVSDGISELEHASAAGDSSVLDLFLVHGYAFAGRAPEARELLERVKASARSRYVCAYEVGSAHAALGDVDQALAWLSRALTERSDCVVWLRVEPWLDRLVADKRFAPLASRFPSAVPSLHTLLDPGPTRNADHVSPVARSRF